MNKDLIVIIMAGGLGTRMESNLPKVIHKLSGKPMINYILKNLKKLEEKVNVKQILIVVGKYRSQIQEAIESGIKMSNITYVNQGEALGTGHAIQCCSDELKKYPGSNTLILSGDVPLFSTQSMYNLICNLRHVRIIVTNNNNPAGYGRIVINNGKFDKIVEHNDCSSEELLITMVNCGIYAIDTELLCRWLPSIKNNNSKGEYYLTDIIEIIKREEGIDIDMYFLPSEKRIEVTGVNTIAQLNELETLIKKIE